MRGIALPRIIRFPKVIDLFYPLLFIYFITLHADKLSIRIGYTFRLNNLVALALVICLMIRLRKRFFSIDRWLAYSLGLIACSILISLIGSPYKSRCCMFFFWFGFTFLCYFWFPYQIFQHLDQEKVLKVYFASFVFVGCYALWQLISGPLGMMDPFVGQHLGKLARPHAMAAEPSYYCLYMTPFMMMQTLLYVMKQTKSGLTPISHQLSDKSLTWSPHLASQGDGAVLSKHCPHPSERQSEATEERFVQSPGEKWGLRLFFYNICYFICASGALLYNYFTFFAIALLFPKYRKNIIKFFFKFLLLLTPFMLLFMSIAISHVLKFGKGYGSVAERYENNAQCLELFLQRPIIGYGFGGVAPERVRQGLVCGPEAKHLERVRAGVNYKISEPSNITIEILASLGVIGFLAFFLLIILYAINHFKTRSTVLHDAFFISVVVMLVTWQFNQSLLRTYTWTHFAFACALLRTTLYTNEFKTPLIPFATQSLKH